MASDELIRIHNRRLRQASAKIKEAKAIINEANSAADKAALSLLANWEGSAADAFAREQHVFNSWVVKMMEILEELSAFLNQAGDMYEQVDQAVANMIKSK